MDSKYPCKHDTTNNFKKFHKLKIIMFPTGKNQRDFIASYSIRSPTVYETKQQKDQ